MTQQDNYLRLSLESIKVPRDERQRRIIDPGNLLESVKRWGVLNPIIITEDFTLVAGERRLEASRQLGLEDIPCRLLSSLDAAERQIIELEENVKRSSLPWRDEVRAVGKIHESYIQEAQAAGEEWTQVKTARAIGMPTSYMTETLRVFRDIDSSKIATCIGIRQAYNMLSRVDERMLADAMSDIMEAGEEVFGSSGSDKGTPNAEAETGLMDLDLETLATLPSIPNTPKSPGKSAGISTLAPIARPLAAPPPRPESILHANFLEWASNYTGPTFNFIHCDFPYGVNVFAGAMGSGSGLTAQRGGKAALDELTEELYNDSPDTYWALLDCLCANLDKLMAPSAHLMFWFSMKYYHETLQRFRLLAPSLIFNPFPLIWLKSDNRGILPDARRSPRQIYETCFIASRDDRLIARSVSNGYSAPTDKTHHISTKPRAGSSPLHGHVCR